MVTETDGVARRRSGAGPWIALALTCVGLAVIDRTLVRDALHTIGPTYRKVIDAEVTSSLRELPGAEPRNQRLRLRRTDEVLVTNGAVAVVQSTLSWAEATGDVPLAQTTGLYGVDRRDRQNLAGFGDRERTGWFRAPPNPPRDRLVIWDSFHPGPLVFTYESTERREGIALLRYRLDPADNDEVDASETYDPLPLVPERYRVRSRVEQASLLIEPRTGRVVDREQRTQAWFVLATDPTPLGDAHRFSWRYSIEDRTRILAEVRADLRLLTWVEQVMPGALLAFAVLAAAMAVRRRRQRDHAVVG